MESIIDTINCLKNCTNGSEAGKLCRSLSSLPYGALSREEKDSLYDVISNNNYLTSRIKKFYYCSQGSDKPNDIVNLLCQLLLGEKWSNLNESGRKIYENMRFQNADFIIPFLEAKGKAAHCNPFIDKSSYISYPVTGLLYHANSASTSLDYIRRGYLYSRKYGDAYAHNAQTEQRSDSEDRKHDIYGDIFFDNGDIPTYTRKGISYYGPVTFVLGLDTLSDHLVRITKSNPIKVNWSEKKYSDIYFSQKELQSTDSDFSTNTQWHTTLFACDVLPLKGNLKAIYLQHFPTNNPGKDNQAKDKEDRLFDAISSALKNAGLNIPVIMRPILCTPVDEQMYSTRSVNRLWDIP